MDRTDSQGAETLVTLSQIAELARVGASAVSNWRKRYSDFPAPVSNATGGRDLFSLADVEDWLARYERLDPTTRNERLLFRAADILRADSGTDRLVETLCAALSLEYCLSRDRRLGGMDGQVLVTDAPSSLIARVEAANPELGGVFSPLLEVPPERADAILNLVAQMDLDAIRATFEWVLERRSRFVDTKTGKSLTALLMALGDDRALSVFDPAAGEAGFLLAAGAESGAQLYGQEINEGALRVAKQRLLVHERQAHLRIGDSLIDDRFPDLRADAIYCDPPYGAKTDTQGIDISQPRWLFGPPTAKTTEFAWLQHVVHHLSDSGRGYVLLPAGSLHRGGREADIRRELVRRGAIETIIGLPGRTADRTSTPLAVWVVKRPDSPTDPDRILFINVIARHSDDDRPLNANTIRRISGIVRRWRTAGDVSHDDHDIAESVALLDVLGTETNLLPSRWVQGMRIGDARDYVVFMADTAQRFAELHRGLSDNRPAAAAAYEAPSSSPTWVSVRSMMADNLATVMRGVKVAPDACLPSGVRALRTRDIKDGRIGEEEPCFVELSGMSPQPALTKRGDVIVSPGSGKPRAVVDPTGGHVLVSPLQAVRIHGNWIDSELVAAFLQSPRNRRFVAGTTLGHARVDVRDLEIPVLPKDESDRLLEALSEIRETKRRASDLIRGADNLRDALLDAANVDADRGATIGGDGS